MFSRNSNLARGFFALAVLTCVLFFGCKMDGGDTPPPVDSKPYSISGSVARVWKYNTDENQVFVITDKTFTEYYTLNMDDSGNDKTGKQAITYSLPIVKHTDYSKSSGYIYIKDEAGVLLTANNFCVIKWDDYAGSTIKFLGLPSLDAAVEDSDQSTLETSMNNNYDWTSHTACDLTKVDVLVDTLGGTYKTTTNQETFVITDITFTNIIDYTTETVVYSGVIVETTDPSYEQGYIYIKYSYAPYGTADNFYAIHWKNKNAGTIELSGASLGSGFSTLAMAKANYTVANGYFGTYTILNRK